MHTYIHSYIHTYIHSYIIYNPKIKHKDMVCEYDPVEETISVDGKLINSISLSEIETNWFDDSNPIVEMVLENNTDVVVQYLDSDSTSISVSYKGTRFKAQILTPKQKELYALMPEPLVIDESKFIIAPMPGSVVAISVNVGDRYVSFL